ncbi:MAG: hypothetical protein PHH08_04010 [Candidatus ainarchaeum sp.]|nr:hypothetical protein [Candidatus ainarchaeum sp.]
MLQEGLYWVEISHFVLSALVFVLAVLILNRHIKWLKSGAIFLLMGIAIMALYHLLQAHYSFASPQETPLQQGVETIMLIFIAIGLGIEVAHPRWK